ncbi:MAG: PPC domain-containing protein [Zavarzinella sp.]
MWLRKLLVTSVAVLMSAPLLLAQNVPGLPSARLETIFPMGGKAGSTIESVIITGQDLDDVDRLVFSHPGIKAEAIPEPPPKVDPKKPAPKEAPGPKPPAKFKITIDANVPPGFHEVRVHSKFGMSGPRMFVVGSMAEQEEKEPNNDVPQAQKVDVNNTINARVDSATDVDIYQMTLKKGQGIVVSCICGSIDSKLHPLLEVYTANDRRLASVSSLRGNDISASFVAPVDGDYFIRVAEFAHTTGNATYFYRLNITTGPWIDAVFPPVVEPGKASKVTLIGRNLPGGTPITNARNSEGLPLQQLDVTINAPAAGGTLTYQGRVDPAQAVMDGFGYQLPSPGGLSNAVFVGFAQFGTTLEKEPNDDHPQAQPVVAPTEIVGRIDRRNDLDWYRLDLKKGDTLYLDMAAARLGASLDGYFSVRSVKTPDNVMLERDDDNNVMDPKQFYTLTSDPEAGSFSVPEDGSYLVQVGSRDGNAVYGPQATYRLRIAPPKPDFRVVVMAPNSYQPDVTLLRAGGKNYLNVYAFRLGGYTGPIKINVEGLPGGVTCKEQFIGDNLDYAAIVLEVADNVKDYDGQIQVKASADIAGKPVTHVARSASILWSNPPNQNVTAETRIDRGTWISVRGKAYYSIVAMPEKAYITKPGESIPMPLALKPGDKINIPYQVKRIAAESKQPITLAQLSNKNANQLSVRVNNGQKMAPLAADKADGVIQITVQANATPGLFPIHLSGTLQMDYERDAPKKKKIKVLLEEAVTPFSVLVLPKALAKVSAAPKGTLKAGESIDVVLKVERLEGYQGPFTVKVTVPNNPKGISFKDVAIPANSSEMNLVFTAAGDVNNINLQNITVEVIGKYDNKYEISQDTKFNLNVTKAPPPKK